MQHAIPYRRWVPPSSISPCSSSATENTNLGEMSVTTAINVKKLVAENAVVVIGRRGCCMCIVVRQLLLGLGVNPPVVDVDDHQEPAIIKELSGLIVGGHLAEKDDQAGLQFPAVFVHGKLFGGLERVMATHISGELVPILKQAGAIWL